MFDFISSIPVFGGGLVTFLAMIIVLGTVVSVHEYGHYIVGKWCGIHAEVFSVGFGKVLWSRVDKHGTQWQIAAVPLGGYVKFLGDLDAASTQGKEKLAQLSPEDAARSFPTAPLMRKALTVLAGPFANFILSIAVFACLAMMYGRANEKPIVGEILVPNAQQYEIREGDQILAVNETPVSDFGVLGQWAATAQPDETPVYRVEREGEVLDVTGPFPSPAYVANVSPVSAASKAGLKSGDLIISLDGNKINSFSHLQQVVRVIEQREMPIVINRAGEELTLSIRPREQEFENGNGEIEKRILLGVSAGAASAFAPAMKSVGPIDALYIGVVRTWSVIEGSLRGIKLMFQGAISPKNLQGPVGIAHMSSDVAKMGLPNLIALIGIISTAIGFLNLMPFPILDGGHLVQFAYQGIVGKPMNERFVRIASIISLSLLLSLMLFSTSNDLVRWFL